MIINSTKNKVVCNKHRMLYGIIEQALGLMFRRRLVDEAWVFVCAYESAWDLTNMFVFQSIDVLWLDRSKRVLKKTTMKPFTLIQRGHRGTFFFIELPAGAARDVEIGDIVDWTRKPYKASL